MVYVVSGVALAVLLATLVTWAMPDENRVIPAPGVGNAAAPLPYHGEADPGTVEKGRVYYAQICMSCHGVRGDGLGEWAYRVTPRPADLRSMRTQARTNDELFRIITDGLRGTPMIGWKAQLSDAQRRQVVAYLRTLGRAGSEGG
jgi:mono/diheme cytochrome c family protein